MRQAGRFLPEYRKLRERHDIITIAKNPELASEVACLPVKALGVDAAILFADIMLPLGSMGVRFHIQENIGPIIENSISDVKSAEKLRELEPKADVPFVLEAISQTKKRLDGQTPLIGFCGAPFTLASYLIEGRPSRDFVKTKSLMYRDPKAWGVLMGKLAEAMTEYLKAQVAAGVDAVQLFDSWVGCLSPEDYRIYVKPFSRRIFRELEGAGVPRIHFGTGTATLLEEMKEAGGDVFSVDWRVPIDAAWATLGSEVAIQGNLDPAALLAEWETVRVKTDDILTRAAGRPGHIFNLGHGMLAEASPENAKRLVNYVHQSTARS